MRRLTIVATAAAALILGGDIAHADDGDIPNVTYWLHSDRHPTNNDPGCESILFPGLSPYIRSICDSPVYADGGWIRYRALWSPEYVHSTCFGRLYDGGCPNWAKDDRDITAATNDQTFYIVKPDAIPDGEPGHLG